MIYNMLCSFANCFAYDTIPGSGDIDLGLEPADELSADQCLDELSAAAWAHMRRRLADSSQPKLRVAMRHLARFERRVGAKRPDLFVVPDQ